MDSSTLERCIHNLGSSFDLLVAIGVIPNLPLQDVYEGKNSLVLEPEAGIELIFWPETKRLEEIQIVLGKNMGKDTPVYSGELPNQYAALTTQASVRSAFGKPLSSEGHLQLSGTQISLGGWDTYQVSGSLHEAAFVDFQYNEDLSVDRIIFALISRH